MKIMILIVLMFLLSGCALTGRVIATPTPTLSPEVQDFAYMDATYNKITQCRNAQDAFYSTMVHFGEGTMSWDQDLVLKELDQIESNCTNLFYEKPPDNRSITNNYLKQASNEFQLFVDDFRNMIKNDDPSLIEPANSHYQQGNSYIDLSAQALVSKPEP